MCYEMHQYTQKLSKTATNATALSPPCFPSHHCADDVELHPLHQSQSWQSAKSAVSGAVILPQMQKKICTPCFTLVLPPGCLIFPFRTSVITNICTALCRSPLIKQINVKSLSDLQQQQICPATNRQQSSSVF